MKNATNRSRTARKKAAVTRKRRAGGKKAAAARKAASLDEIKFQMDVVNDLFNTDVIGKRRIAALDDVYTSDARILPPGAPLISGREAIKKFWKDWINSANPKSAVLTSVDVIPSSDGAIEIGRAKLTYEPEGQSPVQAEIKYVVYWKQEGDRWKWHVDIWNQNA